MTTKPSHRAYVVEDMGKDRKARWTEIGAVWPHKSGDGFDVLLPLGVSVAGRIVCRAVTEDDATAE